MSWIRIDDRAPWHRKILDAGPAAAWLWVCGLAYANQQTAHDGFIPEAAIPFLPIRNAESLVPDLLRVGLWDRLDRGYLIHDYHDFQPTKEEVEELRSARSRAGQAGGKKSGEARRKQRDEANAKQKGSKREAKPKQPPEANTNPVPSRPDPVQEEKDPPIAPQVRRPAERATDDGCMGMAVTAWADGVSEVTRKPFSLGTGKPTFAIVDAIVLHCPDLAGRVSWAREQAVAWASECVANGWSLSPFRFVDWVNSPDESASPPGDEFETCKGIRQIVSPAAAARLARIAAERGEELPDTVVVATEEPPPPPREIAVPQQAPGPVAAGRDIRAVLNGAVQSDKQILSRGFRS